MPAQVAALSTPLTSCALRAVRRAGAAVAQDEGHLRHRDGHADGAGLRLAARQMTQLNPMRNPHSRQLSSRQDSEKGGRSPQHRAPPLKG